jgi:hypothetical protein
LFIDDALKHPLCIIEEFASFNTLFRIG